MTAWSPDLSDVIRELVESRLAEVHTAMPGRVVSFDAAALTVDVQPLAKQAYTDEEGNRVPAALPIIPGVPVWFPGGAATQITWTITAGDRCWLIFAESSLDASKARPDVADPGDDRRHHLADAWAFVGGTSTAGDLDWVVLATALRTELNAIWAAIRTGHSHIAPTSGGETSTAVGVQSGGGFTAPANPGHLEPGHVHGDPEPETLTGTPIALSQSTIASTKVKAAL